MNLTLTLNYVSLLVDTLLFISKKKNVNLISGYFSYSRLFIYINMIHANGFIYIALKYMRKRK